FVFGRHASREHLGRRFDCAQRIAQLMGEAGRELPKRRQPLRAAHGRFRFVQVTVRLGQLLGDPLEFFGLLAIGRRQRVGQISDRGEYYQAQQQLLLHVRVELVARRIEVKNKRDIRSTAYEREQRRSHLPQSGRGRNQREQQDQIIAAG